MFPPAARAQPTLIAVGAGQTRCGGRLGARSARDPETLVWRWRLVGAAGPQPVVARSRSIRKVARASCRRVPWGAGGAIPAHGAAGPWVSLPAVGDASRRVRGFLFGRRDPAAPAGMEAKA